MFNTLNKVGQIKVLQSGSSGSSAATGRAGGLQITPLGPLVDIGRDDKYEVFYKNSITLVFPQTVRDGVPVKRNQFIQEVQLSAARLTAGKL